MKKLWQKQRKILLFIALGITITSMSLYGQCFTNRFAASNYSTGTCANHMYQSSLGSLSNIYGSCGGLTFSPPLTGGDIVIKTQEFGDRTLYNIFPNPNMGTIYLEGGDKNEELIVSIISLTGQRLFTTNKYVNSAIDLVDLAPGAYVLYIKNSKNQLFTYKIIKL